MTKSKLISDLEALIEQRDSLARQLVTATAEINKLKANRVEVEITQEAIRDMDDFAQSIRPLTPRKYSLLVKYKDLEYTFEGWEFKRYNR